jgi:integrase
MQLFEQAPLFDFGLDMRAAEEVRRRIMNAKYAVNTIRNYESSWRSFERWCRDAGGRSSLPATPQACIDHASWCIAEGLRLETVHLRLKAINHFHKQYNLTPLPFDAVVREFLRNARRALCEKPQGKDALSALQLRRIAKAFHSLNPLDIRDRAMLLVCFASGWRCSELVSLDLRDIKYVKEGIILRLGKSKTDQEGKGRLVGVNYGKRPLTCPVRALNEWLGTRGVWAGPLFTRLDGSKVQRERLDSDGVRRAVKRGFELIGEDATTFGAHSLRAGMITTSIENGASETAIMQRTGHKCYETLRRYVRPAQVFRFDPLAGVL